MRFSIITPTYKRAEKLLSAVRSVQNQTYQDWELIIINDSPADQHYQTFASSINDSRIHYYVNSRNMGVNYSRNFALDHISADSKWIIFLDDDDYLAPDALTTFFKLIQSHRDIQWFVTNRAYKNGTVITKAPQTNKQYSFIRDCLLLRRLSGDMTHAINTNAIHAIRFSKFIKQGEEWLFFYQLGLKKSMYYLNYNCTITEGYGDLNFRSRTFSNQLQELTILLYEGFQRKLIIHPTFLLYILGRYIKLFLRRGTIRV